MSIESIFDAIPNLILFGFFLLYYFVIRPREKAERDALQTRVSELEDDKTRLQEENEALRTENGVLRSKNHSLQIENQRLQNQVNNLYGCLIGVFVIMLTVIGFIIQHYQG